MQAGWQVQQLVDVQKADSAEGYKAHCAEVYHTAQHAVAQHKQAALQRYFIVAEQAADKGQSQDIPNRLDDHDLMFC